MHHIEVGKVFGSPPWPEGSEYNWHGRAGEPGGAHDLMLRFTRPSSSEVGAVRTGEAEFALVELPPAVFLLYRFGIGVPWSDCPYSYHLLPAGSRVPPPAEGSEEQRALLTVLLLDAPTGVVKVIRAVTLSPEFTLKLHDAIRRQIAALWPGQARYTQHLAGVYRQFPTTNSMLAAATARCLGGGGRVGFPGEG